MLDKNEVHVTTVNDSVSLRDRIAMQAITSCVLTSGNRTYPRGDEGPDEKLYDCLAARAYELADAMLKAREK